jgi:hypothetical protein
MKKFASVTILVFTLIFSNFIPSVSFAAPDLTKYAWPPDYISATYGQPLLGYSFSLVDDFNQSNTGESFSFIRTNTSQRWCKDFKDPQCIKDIESGANFWTNQILPPCENTADLINCIESVNLVDSSGKREKLKLEKLIPGNTWEVGISPKIEAGSSSSRWVSASSQNTNKGFKVTVSGALGLTMSSRTEVSAARLASFQASVEPYEKLVGNYNPPQVYEPPTGRFFGGNTPNHCIWVDTNECGVLSEFPEASKIELVLHLPTEISGWIIGRVDQPIFASEILGASRITGQGLSRVTLTGYPVNIPLFSTKIDLAKASPELKNYYQENKFCKQKLPECSGYFGGNLSGSFFDITYKIFQFFESSFDNTANIVFPRWSIRSLPGIDQTYDRCKSASPVQINGIVTTNASIYQGAPPIFENDSFVYKVAGLHLLPSKEVFQGTYDLVLKSEFARCLYGFSGAPIKAAVEVTNSDGTNRIVTTSFVEKNGWISVSIKGFTFSQPTIKLKLLQEKSIPVASATPATTPDSNQITASTSSKTLRTKSTITCTKGKTIKKVTGTKPSCPKGYKKK